MTRAEYPPWFSWGRGLNVNLTCERATTEGWDEELLLVLVRVIARADITSDVTMTEPGNS